MDVVIRGHRPPGRAFCSPDGVPLSNVHVGVQVRTEAVGLHGGDEPAPEWSVEVRVVAGPDFRGPAVHGVKGERFLYVTWGNVADDGHFGMFRRAKLMLNRIDSELIAAADQPGARLVGRVELSDARGHPRCARVDPPAIVWSLESNSRSAG